MQQQGSTKKKTTEKMFKKKLTHSCFLSCKYWLLQKQKIRSVPYKGYDAPKCCGNGAKFYRAIHKIGTRCFYRAHPSAEGARSRQFWILGHLRSMTNEDVSVRLLT